ncbi:MAG: ATP-binding protein [Pirellulales bacterium]
MNHIRTCTTLAALAGGSALVALVVCLLGGFTAAAGESWTYLLIAAGTMGATACAGAALWQVLRHERAAMHYFDRLSRIDPHDLTTGTASAELPTLEKTNPWRATAERLQRSLADACRRAEEAEHTRTSLEVRARRCMVEHEQIKAVLEGLAEPVIAIDDFDEVVLANSCAESLLGFDLDQAPERALDKLVRCEELLELLTDTRRRKGPLHRRGELKFEGAPGVENWYSVEVQTIPSSRTSTDSGESTHGAVAVLREISGHKDAQKRIAEFVSAVSHEMKTPLTGIRAYVELLADGDAEDEETREEFLQVINSQASRLQRLIDNLLNLARIEAGVVQVSKEPQSLNELMEESLGVVQPAAEAKQIVLQSDLSPMYLGVLADQDMLLQAAINLLSNAIKYTPEGGRVTLRSRMNGPEVTFEVEDTGVGLSPEDCQKIFEKFYRVRKDEKMSQGTGLGLPLARHIVEDVHSGSLTVESEPGVGSTFRVVLPGAAQLTAASSSSSSSSDLAIRRSS